MTTAQEMDLFVLKQDLNAAARSMGSAEARYLVDTYYEMQDFRIRATNQRRAQSADGEPSVTLLYMSGRFTAMEREMRGALDDYSGEHLAGRWAKSIVGIGPVIAAGLLAHIDVQRARTAGQVWRFAGLDPTVAWGKGERRPWNARLKVLCWKAGESFVKVQNRDDDVYGGFYAARKMRELRLNDAGAFADQAAAALQAKKIGKDTDAYAAYSAGKLPPAHIHARAKRYAVKLFLAHLHHVMYEVRFGTPPPEPYILENPAVDPSGAPHTQFIGPPNWPM